MAVGLRPVQSVRRRQQGTRAAFANHPGRLRALRAIALGKAAAVFALPRQETPGLVPFKASGLRCHDKCRDGLFRYAGRAYRTWTSRPLTGKVKTGSFCCDSRGRWFINVTCDVAEPAGVTTFSQFGEWVSGGGEVKLAASSEFVNSPPALPAFQAAYGFTLSPDQLIVLSGGDTAATIQAASRQTSGANAAMVYGTDGQIAFADLVVLEDDKQVQPVYQPAPVIRQEVLAEHPQIEELLAPVFESLTLETLQELNGKVQVEGLPASDVAQEFLTANGLLR